MYTRTNWVDGQNKYHIKTQADAVINSDVKLVYSGIGGTPTSAANMNKMEQGIYDADAAASLAGKTDNYYLTSSTTGNIGALVLDGIDDYATLPASVGQLTNGSNSFELIIKFKLNVNSGGLALISKADSAYSATTSVKGWQLYINGAVPTLIGFNSNGGTYANLPMTGLNVLLGIPNFIKLSFDGTTITLGHSVDGINYTTVTSTNAALITAMSTSDNVLTQIGRYWQGSGGYGIYFNGTIYTIQLTKSGTLTNRYEFKNFGANQTVSDTVGTSHGTSAGGAVQGVSGTNYTRNTSGKYTALTDNMRFMMDADATAGTNIQPTLALDSLPSKPIIGATIQAGKTYDIRYKSGIDSYVAVTQEDKLVCPTLTLNGSAFTVSGLDLNRDGGVYYIEVLNPFANGTGYIDMTINGDATSTNYYSGQGVNATISTTGIHIGEVTMTGVQTSTMLIRLSISGGFVTANSVGQLSLSASLYSRLYFWQYKNVQSNVTSITFSSSAAFTAGTVKIYKR